MLQKDYNKIDPAHYTDRGIEPIRFINSHNLNFNLGNVIKYLTRAGEKPGEHAIIDLQKARRYLDFELERLQHIYVIEEDLPHE